MPSFNSKIKGYYLDSAGNIRCDEESLSKFLSFFESVFHRSTSHGHTLITIAQLIAKGDLDHYESGTDEYDIQIDRDGITLSNCYTGEAPIKCSPEDFWDAFMQWEGFIEEKRRRELLKEGRNDAPYFGFVCGAFVGVGLAFAATVVLLLMTFGPLIF